MSVTVHWFATDKRPTFLLRSYSFGIERSWIQFPQILRSYSFGTEGHFIQCPPIAAMSEGMLPFLRMEAAEELCEIFGFQKSLSKRNNM